MSGETYWDLIGILSEIRSGYNCFDENEEPYYRALSEAIHLVSAQSEVTEEEVKEYCRKRGLSIIDSALLKKYASAQTESRWIPCSERLPEESGLYIVTHVGRWLEPPGTRYYNIGADGGFWSGHPGYKVLAWMPLPKPYRGEPDEEGENR